MSDTAEYIVSYACGSFRTCRPLESLEKAEATAQGWARTVGGYPVTVYKAVRTYTPQTDGREIPLTVTEHE